MGIDADDATAAVKSLGWKIKLAMILIPTLAYGVLLLGQQFPRTERVQAGVSTGAMFKEALAPMFIVVWICMWLTAASELGPNQWVPTIFGAAGLPGILVLVYITVLMAVLRFFAGPLAHRLSPVGLALVLLDPDGDRTVLDELRAHAGDGARHGDDLLRRHHVLLADDAGHHVGALPARRGVPPGDHGRHGHALGRHRHACDGRDQRPLHAGRADAHRA
jgi:hypothetical protein